MTQERATLLLSLIEHPGWSEFVRVKDEHLAELRASIDHVLMDTKALSAARLVTISAKRHRIQAIHDLFDAMTEAHKVLAPTERRA